MTSYIEQSDCLAAMQGLPAECIDLTVTSPPYYNAREYAQWDTVQAYMNDMRAIFAEVYRITKNHRYCVVNVGDITAQTGRARWSMQKLPLGAMFTTMMCELGFEYIDDYIWDKGEPQSKRHLGNPPYPFYQYPVNCYEHILIFAKHQLDKTKIPCPDCQQTITQSNSCTGVGVQSWECKNPNCPTKSAHGRGKRFSARSVMMSVYQTEANLIGQDITQKWRRDIVRIPPVIKINAKGENTVGHTAPYPEDIPEMAIRYYSGVGDVVLDPFLGSGTTARVCVRTGRKYIGYERDAAFYEIAKKSIEEVTP